MILQGRKVAGRKLDVVQGSPEWHEERKNHVCASDAASIMGLNRWCSRQEILERKLGLIPEVEKTYLMQRGIELEPIARDCAQEMLDTFFIPRTYESLEYPWMMASLDGVCIDNKIVIEIKCTNLKNHELAKNGKIPEYYYPQVQHQMAVCQVDCIHYFSYDGNSGIVVVVERDEEFIKRMIEMEYDFYQEMTNDK